MKYLNNVLCETLRVLDAGHFSFYNSVDSVSLCICASVIWKQFFCYSMFFLRVSISSRRRRRSCKNKISMNVWIVTITLWELGLNTVCWWTAEKGMVSNRGTFTIYDKRANKKYTTTSIVLGNYPAEGCWRNMSECKHDVVLCQCIWQVIITAKKPKTSS